MLKDDRERGKCSGRSMLGRAARAARFKSERLMFQGSFFPSPGGGIVAEDMMAR